MTQTLFEPENMYYLRTQSIAQDYVFKSPWDYTHFLNAYQNYTLHIADTLTYCILPNQFHFIIRIQNNATTRKWLDKSKNPADFSQKMSKQFGKFISSFTQSYNQKHNNIGPLFIRPAKRDLLIDAEELNLYARHIHQLPSIFQLESSFEKWKYSSYPFITNERASFINPNEITSSFNSIEDLTRFNEIKSDLPVDFYPLPTMRIAA
jgi:putative transposase